jgi:hypothetical protein
MASPPLRWVAEEPLTYERATNELHRFGCSRAVENVALKRGEGLELIWAPIICSACSPDVTLALGS